MIAQEQKSSGLAYFFESKKVLILEETLNMLYEFFFGCRRDGNIVDFGCNNSGCVFA